MQYSQYSGRGVDPFVRGNQRLEFQRITAKQTQLNLRLSWGLLLLKHWTGGLDLSSSLCVCCFVYKSSDNQRMRESFFLVNSVQPSVLWYTDENENSWRSAALGQPQVTGPQVKYTYTKCLKIPPQTTSHRHELYDCDLRVATWAWSCGDAIEMTTA